TATRGVVWQARLGVDCLLRLKECSDKAVTKGEGDQVLSRTADFTRSDMGVVRCGVEGEESDLPPLAVVVAMPTGDRFTSCAGGELHCDWYCGAAKSTSAYAEVGVATFLGTVSATALESLFSELSLRPIN
ncbi:hypothetical protein J6590_095568, partial [Homalodisca vitripennis]